MLTLWLFDEGRKHCIATLPVNVELQIGDRMKLQSGDKVLFEAEIVHVSQTEHDIDVTMEIL